ncbi:MAG: hypothetical protein VX546_06600, partial [Myxococcota bacterium]|nr:hypothetical protein [Myxococcota bacterium]
GCGPAYGSRCDTGEATVRVRLLNAGALTGEIDIESEFTARTRPDLYTMVDADGIPCPPTNLDPCRVWGRGGGIDFLNAEASVILQSMPGFEGTEGGTNTQYTDDGLPTGNVLFPDQWITWAADTAQPGTIGIPGRQENDGAGGKAVERATQPFVGGVVCTRYAPGEPNADANGLVILPGCRGAISATVDDNDPANFNDNVIDVRFDEGYSPKVDGCVFGRKMVDGFLTYWVRAVNADGSLNTALQDELYETCFNANQANIEGVTAGSPLPGTEQRVNEHSGDVTWFSYSRRPVLNAAGLEVAASRITLLDGIGAGHLFHPLAGCENSTAFNPKLPAPPFPGPDTPLRRVQFAQNLCQSTLRDFETEFVNGDASVFRNELAAISFNFMTFLVISSCNSVSGGDDLSEAECFLQSQPWTVGRCSFSSPQYCRNVRSFLGVGGIGRNDVRAGGNASFGRRDFLWQSGADLALKYARRNVFGISADFAEDNTKTNWGVEFTWIAPTPWVDNNSMTSTTDSSAFNLTVSVDRPTFINFLNANRTFFFNTQWFFNYLPDHSDGFTTFGDPFNVLFTFAVFTGYYQDRLLPQLVTVYDFGSQSAGFLPQLGYRFNEAFSVTFGVSFFVGRSQYVPMPLRGFAPRANRAGPHKYEDGVQRLLANFMRRDEAWMRLRWTF